MQVIIEKKENTQRTINRIISEKQGDMVIVMITDTDYAKNNGYQKLIDGVDMEVNNVIIIKP